MNDPIEREAENIGVAVANTDQEVVAETVSTTPDVGDVQGAVETTTDHPVTTETEVVNQDVVVENTAEVIASDTVGEESYEIPSVSASNDETETQAEMPADDDPLFGPIKRVFAGLLGDD